MDSLCALLVGLSLDLHTAGDHEGRIEAQPEVTYDGDLVILVLVEELLCSREGDLIDVLLYLLSCHPDTTVADSDSLGFGVEADAYI